MSATTLSFTWLAILCVSRCCQATPRQTPAAPWFQHDRGKSFFASGAPPRQDPRGANRILGQWDKQAPWMPPPPPQARPPRLPPPPPFGSPLRHQPRVGHRLGPNPAHILPRTPHQRTPQDAPLIAPVPREVMDVLPGAISRVMSSYRRSSSPTTTTTEPPVIWFPNQSEECEQVSEESLLRSLYLRIPSLWCLYSLISMSFSTCVLSVSLLLMFLCSLVLMPLLLMFFVLASDLFSVCQHG